MSDQPKKGQARGGRPYRASPGCRPAVARDPRPLCQPLASLLSKRKMLLPLTPCGKGLPRFPVESADSHPSVTATRIIISLSKPFFFFSALFFFMHDYYRSSLSTSFSQDHCATRTLTTRLAPPRADKVSSLLTIRSFDCLLPFAVPVM